MLGEKLVSKICAGATPAARDARPALEELAARWACQGEADPAPRWSWVALRHLAETITKQGD